MSTAWTNETFKQELKLLPRMQANEVVVVDRVGIEGSLLDGCEIDNDEDGDGGEG